METHEAKPEDRTIIAAHFEKNWDALATSKKGSQLDLLIFIYDTDLPRYCSDFVKVKVP